MHKSFAEFVAMGGYAGLRLASQRVPALNAAMTAARSDSYRSLLAATKAPTAAARQTRPPAPPTVPNPQEPLLPEPRSRRPPKART